MQENSLKTEGVLLLTYSAVCAILTSVAATIQKETAMCNPAEILPIVKHLYRRYAHDAAKRGKAFQINVSYFAKLIAQPCAYCGADRAGCYTQKQYAVKELRYNGVDRVDSFGDYTEDNTIACCGKCNAAKTDMALNVFLSSDWLKMRKAQIGA